MRRLTREWGPPALLLAVLIAGWELAARLGWVEDYLLPAPSEVARALVDDRGVLLPDAWVTAQEVLLGFAIALAVGVAVAVALHLSPMLRRALYPLVVASQAVPIIVIAPILVIWFGFGMGPKLIVIALICFFPVVVNTLDGLRAVDRDQTRMLRTLGAGRWDTFRRLELPAALPYVFSGAKIAVAVAVIGAVFGELVGSDARARARDPGRDGTTPDGARVRGRIDPLRDGDRAVRARVGGRAARGAVGAHQPEPPVSRLLAGCAVLAAVLVLSACGEKSESVDAGVPARELDLTLDWFPNPDHVAIYEAQNQGYLRDVGLDVRPRVPSDPSAPIRQVAAGRTDLAISYEPEVLLARERGLPVVAVAALVQRPLTSLMATGKSGVRSVRDLRGKRVGTAGIPYQAAYLKTILRRANVPQASVKVTNVGASLLAAMLSGRVDATLGAFSNVEGVELRERQQRPWIVPVSELGVPAYDELVLVANSDKLDQQRDDIRLFIAAVSRGARAARRNPATATRNLIDNNPDLRARTTRESVRVTIPALFPEKSDRPFGFMDPVQWRNYGGWMVDNALLDELPDIDSALTNDLLPGAGL